MATRPRRSLRAAAKDGEALMPSPAPRVPRAKRPRRSGRGAAKASAASAVLELSSLTLDSVASAAPLFVLFYMSWNSLCKDAREALEALAPRVQRLGPGGDRAANVLIAAVDMAVAANSELARRYKLSEYPTILLIDGKAVEKYELNMRSTGEMLRFLQFEGIVAAHSASRSDDEGTQSKAGEDDSSDDLPEASLSDEEGAGGRGAGSGAGSSGSGPSSKRARSARLSDTDGLPSQPPALGRRHSTGSPTREDPRAGMRSADEDSGSDEERGGRDARYSRGRRRRRRAAGSGDGSSSDDLSNTRSKDRGGRRRRSDRSLRSGASGSAPSNHSAGLEGAADTVGAAAGGAGSGAVAEGQATSSASTDKQRVARKALGVTIGDGAGGGAVPAPQSSPSGLAPRAAVLERGDSDEAQMQRSKLFEFRRMTGSGGPGGSSFLMCATTGRSKPPLEVSWRNEPSLAPAGGRHVLQFTNVHVLRNHRLVREDLWVRDGRIINAKNRFWEAQGTKEYAADRIIDCGGGILAPGFIDVQINGAFGVDFSDVDLKASDVEKVAEHLLSHGVVGFCPTIVSSHADTYRHVIKQLKQAETGHACRPRRARILGLHLEGPFINPECKGAHDPATLRSPVAGYDSLKALYTEHLSSASIVTLAPELPGAIDAIKALRKEGIVASMGHSKCTVGQAIEAVEAGSTMITHLFNAMTPFHHRDPGLVGLLGTNACPYFGLIVDGIHCHPLSANIVHNTRPKKVVLVTDAMAAMGLPPGRFELGPMAVDIQVGGRYEGLHAVIAGTSTLAGSVVSMDQCVQNFRNFTGCSAAEAIESASRHPAKVLNKLGEYGTLENGALADMVLLNDELEVQATYLAGHLAWKLDPRDYGLRTPTPGVKPNPVKPPSSVASSHGGESISHVQAYRMRHWP